MKRTTLFLLLLTLVVGMGWVYADSHKKRSFHEYINHMKKRALIAGVSEKTIDKYLLNIKRPKKPKTSTHTKHQMHPAANPKTFKMYKAQFITKSNLPYAKEQYKKHHDLLKSIEKVYHVQPRFIIALWGVESHYGRYTGHFPLVHALTILGFHHHRPEFYQRQLVDALVMLNHPKVIPEQLKSAWDGGMGQPQFEPAAYLTYGVDFNKDGFVNIWTTLPDVFASIANFLHKNGWNGQETWGIRVKLPKNFPVKESGHPLKHPIHYWRKLGVTQFNGKPLNEIQGKTAILLPDGIQGEAYLVYPNFDVLMRWNNTIFEGLAVGLLSDAIKPWISGYCCAISRMTVYRH